MNPLEICDLPSATALEKLFVLLREEIIPKQRLELFACEWAEKVLIDARNAGHEIDTKSLKALEIQKSIINGNPIGSLIHAWDLAFTASINTSRTGSYACAQAVVFAVGYGCNYSAYAVSTYIPDRALEDVRMFLRNKDCGDERNYEGA